VAPPNKFFSVRGAVEATKILKSERVDLVHIHNLQSMLWGYAPTILFPRRRIVFTPQVVNLPSGAAEWMLHKMWRFLTPFTFRYIAISESQKEIMVNSGIASREKFSVIQNRLDAEEIHHNIKSDRETVRKKLGISADTVVVCQIGRLVQQKNPLALVHVAEMTRDQAPEALFLLVGAGPLRASLEEVIKSQRLADRVRVMGFRSDAIEILNASDILTLTSRWEGFPYCLLEGIFLKKPIVATDIPGNRDLVRQGETGFLAKNEDEFCERLLELAVSKSLRTSMGNRGHEKNQRLFNLEEMMRDLQAVYDAEPDGVPIGE